MTSLALSAANFVRCVQSNGRLSPYIRENGLRGDKSPWAELCEAVASLKPYERYRHPPGCPDVDWCAGNGICRWDCEGRDENG
jgi:hypothetical protein